MKANDKSASIISIGRGTNNDVVLRDSNISTNHARLIIGADEIVLEDLGSTNGTSIGKVENKISRGTVERTDTVYFGSTSFLVSDLIHQSLPSRVAPTIQSLPGTTSKSSPGRLVTLGMAGVGVLLLLAGFGWLVSHEPNETEHVQDNALPSVPSGPEPAANAVAETATPQESEDISVSASVVNESPIGDTLSQEEKFERSVFLIVCSDVKRETPFRVGTGFAIDSTTVVTSASVIQAMQSLQRNGYPDAFLFSPADQRELQIASMVMHPRYEPAEQAARQAEQKYNGVYDQLVAEPKPDAADRLMKASMEVFAALDHKSTYDVAVINTEVSLDHWLPEVSVDSRLRPKQRINVTGYPIDVQDRFLDRTVPFELSTISSRIGQLVTGPHSSDRRLIADGSPEQHEYAFLGSPVLNSQGQVIGVYTRLSPPVPGSEGEPVHSFDAALFNRVHEFHRSPSSP